MTIFDKMNQTKELSILKTLFPYLSQEQQSSLLYLIPFLEYQSAYTAWKDQSQSLSACDYNNRFEKQKNMIQDLKPFLSKEQQDFLDRYLQISSFMEQNNESIIS